MLNICLDEFGFLKQALMLQMLSVFSLQGKLELCEKAHSNQWCIFSWHIYSILSFFSNFKSCSFSSHVELLQLCWCFSYSTESTLVLKTEVLL